MNKIDLHIHTNASYDGFNTLEQVIDKSIEKGLTTIAITDHDIITEELIGKRTRKIKGIEIITGMEVSTNKGHVIGLFLDSPIKSKDFKETLIEIKNSNGLTYIPHPNRKNNGVSIKNIRENIDLIDLIEYQNTYSLIKDMKLIDEEFKNKAVLFASTDSHKIEMIGSVITIIDNKEQIETRELLLKNFPLKIDGDPFYTKMPFTVKGRLFNWLKTRVPLKNTNSLYNYFKIILIKLGIIDKRFFRNVY